MGKALGHGQGLGDAGRLGQGILVPMVVPIAVPMVVPMVEQCLGNAGRLVGSMGI